LAGHFLNRVANLPVLRLLGAEAETLSDVASQCQGYRQVVMRTLRIAFLSSAVLEFFASVAIASLAMYIGFALLGAISWGGAAQLTLFSGLAILLLAPEYFQPLRTLSQFYHDRAAALAAANSLAELLPDTELPESAAREHSADSLPLASAPPLLQLSQLCIGHTADYPLQAPLNLRLQQGDMLVVCGRSGSGKSTLLLTLAGLMPPLSGAMHYAGRALSPLPIGYLAQRPWIQNGSIADNLRVFAPDASEQQMSALLDSLALSQRAGGSLAGLQTLIGEHGQGLSMGQMRRLALARVLLNPSPVIVLDEPTASLDQHSRRIVLQALLQLRSKALLIVASHDPELIAQASEQLNFDSVQVEQEAE
jgi:ATP-binding cassette, subfamily C, bacterial CydD